MPRTFPPKPMGTLALSSEAWSVLQENLRRCSVAAMQNNRDLQLQATEPKISPLHLDEPSAEPSVVGEGLCFMPLCISLVSTHHCGVKSPHQQFANRLHNHSCGASEFQDSSLISTCIFQSALTCLRGGEAYSSISGSIPPFWSEESN